MPRHCPKCESDMEEGVLYCPFCGWSTGNDAAYRYYYYWSDWLIQFSIAVSYFFLAGSLLIGLLAAVRLSMPLFWTALGFLLLALFNLLVQRERKRHRRREKQSAEHRGP